MRNLSPSLSIGKVQEGLDYFRDAVHGSAMPNFGKKKNKSAIEEKRKVIPGPAQVNKLSTGSRGST